MNTFKLDKHAEEIFFVRSGYQDLPDKDKLDLLKLLYDWADAETAKITKYNRDYVKCPKCNKEYDITGLRPALTFHCICCNENFT